MKVKGKSHLKDTSMTKQSSRSMRRRRDSTMNNTPGRSRVNNTATASALQDIGINRRDASPANNSPRYVMDNTKFHKQPIDPSLFRIKVQRKHLEHLMNDNLDEISKFEVIYKVLKDQLRDHQKKLINMKEMKKK